MIYPRTFEGDAQGDLAQEAMEMTTDTSIEPVREFWIMCQAEDR